MDVSLKWATLVESFDLGLSEDVDRLLGRFAGASHGEKITIQFLLSVWNPNEDWSCGPFDLHEALKVWDGKRRQAFLAWVTDPFWP